MKARGNVGTDGKGKAQGEVESWWWEEGKTEGNRPRPLYAETIAPAPSQRCAAKGGGQPNIRPHHFTVVKDGPPAEGHSPRPTSPYLGEPYTYGRTLPTY